MEVTQLTDVPFEVFTIDDAFRREEVEALLGFVEDRVACPAATRDPPFTESPFTNGKVVHPVLSRALFDRVAEAGALPPVFRDRGGRSWEWVGGSRHVFYAVLGPGDLFGIHTDTGSVWERSSAAGGAESLTCSKHTVLVYLNEPPSAFSGGDTEFFTDAFEPTCTVTPRTGRVVAFDIDRYHRGCEVLSGRKVWVGIELVARLRSE
jgi:hypothetical protein